MRIFQYKESGGKRIGSVVNDQQFVAVSEVAPDLPGDLQELLQTEGAWELALDAARRATQRLPLSGVRMLPLISKPNAIWALALNFMGHIEETGLTTSLENPHIFLRTAVSVVAHGEDIKKPPETVARAFDYEGELGVIIGKSGRHIPIAKAMEHVAGFTCCNEGSVREFQEHNRQFGLGKNFEKSGSYGPWLTTPDEVPDYKAQRVLTRVNGVIRQDCLLNDMLFDVEQVVSYLSTGYALRPGDIIMMGTPGALAPSPDDAPGNDMSKQFGRFKVKGLVHMNVGDIVEVEVTGVGVLRNKISADLPHKYMA